MQMYFALRLKPRSAGAWGWARGAGVEIGLATGEGVNATLWAWKQRATLTTMDRLIGNTTPACNDTSYLLCLEPSRGGTGVGPRPPWGLGRGGPGVVGALVRHDRRQLRQQHAQRARRGQLQRALSICRERVRKQPVLHRAGVGRVVVSGRFPARLRPGRGRVGFPTAPCRWPRSLRMALRQRLVDGNYTCGAGPDGDTGVPTTPAHPLQHCGQFGHAGCRRLLSISVPTAPHDGLGHELWVSAGGRPRDLCVLARMDLRVPARPHGVRQRVNWSLPALAGYASISLQVGTYVSTQATLGQLSPTTSP